MYLYIIDYYMLTISSYTYISYDINLISDGFFLFWLRDADHKRRHKGLGCLGFLKKIISTSI